METEPRPGLLEADQRACARAREALIAAGVAAERLACPHVIERDWLWGYRILFRNVRADPRRNAVANVWRFFGRVWIDWTLDDGYRFDPQEEDPALASRFMEADAIVEMAIGRARGEGSGHRTWEIKERILRERFGIRWKSPETMNPGVTFD